MRHLIYVEPLLSFSPTENFKFLITSLKILQVEERVMIHVCLSLTFLVHPRQTVYLVKVHLVIDLLLLVHLKSHKMASHLLP